MGLVNGMVLVEHVLALLAGPGLVFNSLRGLISRQGLQERESAAATTVSARLGVPAGAGLTLIGLSLFARFFA